MICKQHWESLIFYEIFLLFLVGFSNTAFAQSFSSEKLYQVSIFTPQHSFTTDVEGPVVEKKTGTVYACNFDHEGTIGQITPSGKASLFIKLPNGGICNGIRFSNHGNMLIGDYVNHNILKVDRFTHTVSIFVHISQIHEPDAPNDLVVDSKGHIYASDPNFKAHKGRIWRIEPDGEVVLLDHLNGAANGIEVSPDEKTLYVGTGPKVWAYDLSPKGEISHKRLFIEFDDFVTDGMRCDIKGNLYITWFGKGIISKASPQGKILREINLVGKKPTNVAFGGKDGRTMYVTMMDQGNLESFRVDNPGSEWKKQRSKN